MQLGLEVTPVAFGPVLLRNDDGRDQPVPPGHVSAGPTTGAPAPGWIEWNQPDPAPAAEAPDKDT